MNETFSLELGVTFGNLLASAMKKGAKLTVQSLQSRMERKLAKLRASRNYYAERCRLLEGIIREMDPSRVPPASVSGQASFVRQFDDNRSGNVECEPITLMKLLLKELKKNADRDPRGRRWCLTTLMISYVTWAVGSKGYEYLRRFIPLPCKQTLLNHFSVESRSWQGCLCDISNARLICKLFRRRWQVSDDTAIDVILGVDAMAMEPVVDEMFGTKVGHNNVFMFMVQPFNPGYAPFPVHLMTQDRGNAGTDVRQKLVDLCLELKESGLFVKCVATDGDSGYNELHTKMFNKWWPAFCRGGIESALHELALHAQPIIGDFLHILKNARSRVIKNNVCLLPDGSDSFCGKDLNQVLNLGNVLLDQTSKGKMRDSYALELFKLESFLQLVDTKNWHMAFYIMPYCLWEQIVRNPALALQTRRDLIVCVIEIFSYHLEVSTHLDLSVVSQNKQPGIPQYICSKKHAIRVLNTLMQLLIEIDTHIDNFALDRFGTHTLECCFGQIRLMCGYKHDWKRILRSFSRHRLLQDLCTTLGSPLVVRERENIGGVKLRGETEGVYVRRDELSMRQLYESVMIAVHPGNASFVPHDLVKQAKRDLKQFAEYLRMLYQRSQDWMHSCTRLYHGSSISNATIMSRLIAFTQPRMDDEHEQADDEELDNECRKIRDMSHLEI